MLRNALTFMLVYIQDTRRGMWRFHILPLQDPSLLSGWNHMYKLKTFWAELKVGKALPIVLESSGEGRKESNVNKLSYLKGMNSTSKKPDNVDLWII